MWVFNLAGDFYTELFCSWLDPSHPITTTKNDPSNKMKQIDETLHVFVLNWSHYVALLKYLFFWKDSLKTFPFYYFQLVKIHHEYLNLKDELDSKSAPHVSQLSLSFKLYMHFLYLCSNSFFTLSQSGMWTIHLVVLDLFLSFVKFFFNSCLCPGGTTTLDWIALQLFL